MIDSSVLLVALAYIGVFVLYADFSKHRTSKDPNALTAAPSVFHLCVATALTAAGAVFCASVVDPGSNWYIALLASLATTASFALNSRALGTGILGLVVAHVASGKDCALPSTMGDAFKVGTEIFIGSSAGVAALVVVCAAIATRLGCKIHPIMWAVEAWLVAQFLGDGKTFENVPVPFAGVSIPAFHSSLLAVVGCVFVAYQLASSWSGGVRAACCALILFLPAMVSGRVIEAPIPKEVVSAVHILGCALVSSHMIGYIPLLPRGSAPAAQSKGSRLLATAGYALAAATCCGLFVVGSTVKGLGMASAAAIWVVVLVATFSSRSAPLSPPTDSSARHTAVAAAGIALALIGSPSSGLTTVAASCAATMGYWAMLQLLSERDGPFFSNGARLVVVDLEAIAVVVAAGLFTIWHLLDESKRVWVRDPIGAAQLNPYLSSGASTIGGAVLRYTGLQVSGDPKLFVYVCLIVGTMLLRDAASYASVPVTAHLGGAVASSGKGMRTVAAITADGATADSSLELVRVMDEMRDIQPITFFATRKDVASHPEVLDMYASCGCEVGILLTPEDVRRATEELVLEHKAAVEAATGRTVRWARTVDGSSGADLTALLSRCDLTLVLWSAWPRDWASHPDTAAADALEECTGYGKPQGARGAVFRFVMDPSLVQEGVSGNDDGAQERAFDSLADVVTRLAEAEDMTIAPLSDVVAHRGFELEA